MIQHDSGHFLKEQTTKFGATGLILLTITIRKDIAEVSKIHPAT
jgi:hypothetical protein